MVARRILGNFVMKLWRCSLRHKEILLLLILAIAILQLGWFWRQSKVVERQRMLLKTIYKEKENVRNKTFSVLNNENCQAVITNEHQADLDTLVSQVKEEKLWAWIVTRIKAVWPKWTEAKASLKVLNTKRPRHRKRILVVPGVLVATPFAANHSIQSGGPLGDLYQWSDVIAALHVLGHNVTLTKDIYFAARGLRYDKFGLPASLRCEQEDYDMLFADIITMKAFSFDIVQSKRCLFRVLDAYGTEQMFNNVEYSMIHDYMSQYGKLHLNLKQFYTFYPHTPDNSFMGFALPEVRNASFTKENIGLLYGKDPTYFDGKSDFIKQLMKHMEVHSTLNSSDHLPRGVYNHGVLSQQDYHSLLARAKYFVGVGLPMESTGVLEGLAHGCIFINPKYKAQQQFALQQQGKPTTRQMSSQVPYLEEYVGPPHVLTVDISDETEVEIALQRSKNTNVEPLLPYEFTMQGFLERLNAYIENQDFCNISNAWPPVNLLQTFVGDVDMSCGEVCASKGLICENTFFSILNTSGIFERLGVECDSLGVESSVYCPAYTTGSRRLKCLLQADDNLVSCAGSHESLHRICPCRRYRKGQIALWDDAG